MTYEHDAYCQLLSLSPYVIRFIITSRLTFASLFRIGCGARLTTIIGLRVSHCKHRLTRYALAHTRLMALYRRMALAAQCHQVGTLERGGRIIGERDNMVRMLRQWSDSCCRVCAERVGA